MSIFAHTAKTTATVAPNLVEIRISLEQSASAAWKWNRAETPDNGCEYMWQVSVANGGAKYSFGFYLYKFPGSKPAHGSLQTLIKAGQASVFRDGGDLVQNAIVKAAIEEGKVVLSIADPNLIRAMFGNRPETVTMNTRAVGSNFEVVKVEYRE